MNSLYFIDESGNTGDIATMQALNNFSDQPFFVLSCIGIKDKDKLNRFALELIKNHHIQARELKSTNICSKRRYIASEIIRFLFENSANILIEVVNKKYQLCSIISSYYIMCPYLPPLSQPGGNEEYIIALSTYLCDLLYYNIENVHIKSFIDLWNTPQHDISKVKECFDFVKYLCSKDECMSDSTLELIADTEDVFKYIINKEGVEISKKSFMPMPDYSKTKKYGILPNINCLTNIYARINMIENNDTNIIILHDEQKDFDVPL